MDNKMTETDKITENEVKPKKKMKTWKKVVLIIFAVILLALTAIGIWQRNNIKALYYFMTVGSSKDITTRIENTKKEREEIISNYISGKVRDFTTEEEELIISGELAVEDATELIRSDYEKSVEEEKTDSGKNAEVSDFEQYIADNIIQLYSYKAYYLGQLGQIESAAVKDYSALPNNERTLVSKQSIVDRYIGRANALLTECDAKVNAIMSNLEQRLKAENMDTELVNKIGSSYEEEKALKKAYYISLLNE